MNLLSLNLSKVSKKSNRIQFLEEYVTLLILDLGLVGKKESEIMDLINDQVTKDLEGSFKSLSEKVEQIEQLR